MESTYVVSSIIILFVLFLFGNFLVVLRVKNQTKKAFKEVDDYLKKKIELVSRIISEISKYASFVKKSLKNRPFGVIYDLFRKKGKTAKAKIKKIKKRINKKK